MATPKKTPVSKKTPLLGTEISGGGAKTAGVSVLVSGALIAIALFRAERKDIPAIVKSVFESDTFAIVGWSLAGIFLVVGAFIIHFLMKTQGAEISRLSAQRNELQLKIFSLLPNHPEK
jgi:hypothetical protein